MKTQCMSQGGLTCMGFPCLACMAPPAVLLQGTVECYSAPAAQQTGTGPQVEQVRTGRTTSSTDSPNT